MSVKIKCGYFGDTNYNVEYPMCQMSKSEVMICWAFCGISRKMLGMHILCLSCDVMYD